MEQALRSKAIIKGIVQGIGFRPYLYHLARELRLTGYVANTGLGVEVEVEGTPGKVDQFFCRLAQRELPLMRISNLARTDLKPAGYERFEIRESALTERREALIPPDVGICPECLAEMTDPKDRRFGHPFISCTNCGPRYTIISDLPYDRERTSMARFAMCPACRAEYIDPAWRRFHAEPIACPDCGPRLTLADAAGRPLPVKNPLPEAAALLSQGYILAVKGLGGFHLAVDACHHEAVARLRSLKRRTAKPLALMALDLDKIRQFARPTPEEEELLLSSERPIVLAAKAPQDSLSPLIAPGLGHYGVMLAYTPLHYLLLAQGFTALVMTSGNQSDEPLAIGNEEAVNRLGQMAEYFLWHDREILVRCDDSIVRHAAGRPRMFRRARGYAPAPVFVSRDWPAILACGAEQKNAFCLCRGNQVLLSQHIGELHNLETYEHFTETVERLKKLWDFNPEIIACDLHPDYLSTRYAQEQRDVRLVRVQHHHAHVMSCAAEHKLDGPVLGLAFDGTGLGADGRVWGCEALWAEGAKFKRLAHLDYVHLPGGDAAVKEPWRMALSYLHHTLGEGLWNLDLPWHEKIGRDRMKAVEQMIAQGLNCPLTSSLGRLFDGVSALLGVCLKADYEGQPAVELEALAAGPPERLFDFAWQREESEYVLDIRPLINGVISRTQAGRPAAETSACFHQSLVRLFAELCVQLGKDTGVKQVVLSGGVFMNATLLAGLERALAQRGFKVYSHSLVPTNDGGICLGQAAVAAAAVQGV